MNEASREVMLDEATVGMTLACDLLDQAGTVLLHRDSVLTDGLLAALARRGVARVRVAGEPDGPDRSGARRERAAARLAHLFRHGAQGVDAELRACLQDYRMEAR
ncbi:hypothetical protein [Massilia sp. LjRoot122]|uniref:hypothetical protein n=1 Tax=Massilia sp. LjRoot122 TaxID=3342257 RepID=UPI003ED0365F